MPFDADAAKDVLEESPKPHGFAGGVMAGISLLARWQLGAIFLYAAWTKLKWTEGRLAAGPQQLVNSIKGFKIGWLPEWFIKYSAFAMPWTEAICAVLLVVGLFTRAAAIVTLLMLGVFTWAIWSAMARGIDLQHCGCFGEGGLICDGGDLPCHLVENGVMMAACLVILLTRRHVLAADRLLAK